MSSQSQYIDSAQVLLGDLLSQHNVDEGHGLMHALQVKQHAITAVESQRSLSSSQSLSIVLAALLHDADDRKFFTGPENHNANAVLQQALQEHPDRESIVALVLEMISLVSCSKNGNSLVEPRWKLIPRDADRLEGIGEVGIARCYWYTMGQGTALFTANTPRPQSMEELEAIATPMRFAEYRGGSASMVDHFYDKLLHIHTMSSGNEYMMEEAARRMQIIRQFCLQFGRTGTVDEEYLKSLKM